MSQKRSPIHRKATQATAAEAKSRQMTERLRRRHQLGQKAIETKLSILDFAARHGISPHTARKLKRFANGYSPQELDELCRLRRPGGLPLHFGYVNFLLIVTDKNERARLQERAAKAGWSAPELASRIKVKYGTKVGHGRPMKQPSSPAAGLRQVSEEAERLTRRTKVVVDAVKGLKGKRPSRTLLKQAEMTTKTIASLKRELAALERELRGIATN